MSAIQPADTRGVTDYLKGFAVLTVYANHFINGYVAENAEGYANGFISIFFLLSGYGIYFSLDKLFGQQKGSFVLFFRKRLLRIYPLFWLWCLQHRFSNGLLGFFALDFIQPRSPWFIPALIQCYLIAPFLFLFLRRFTLKTGFLVVVCLFVGVNLVLFSLGQEPVRSIAYRGLFFEHIFLFSLGFLLAGLKEARKVPAGLALISLLFYIFLIHETTPQSLIHFPGRNFVFPLLFALATLLVCHAFISGTAPLPFSGVFRFAGLYSYSIYLFHGLGTSLLLRFGLLQRGNVTVVSVLAVLLAAVLVLLGCCILETTVNEFVFGQRDIRNVLRKVQASLVMVKDSFRRGAAAGERYSVDTPQR